MKEQNVNTYIENVLKNMPEDWLKLTTHRLDIYNEKLAKTEFLEQFEELYKNNNSEKSALSELPTAYDYIRLGHPLSSVLEWGIASLNNIKPDHVISFSSKTIPVLAVFRKNLFEHKKTQICYLNDLPKCFDFEVIKRVYGYNFEVKRVDNINDIPEFEGSTVFISQADDLSNLVINSKIDFLVSLQSELGSVLIVNGEKNESYISEIQHVRRRETIAMTPADCYTALKDLIGRSTSAPKKSNYEVNNTSLVKSVHEITATTSKVLVGSCGLSVQYGIMMGLIDEALEKHKGKTINIIVPPNCYGGTNDQARRVAACIENVEILDLPVDGDNDMVQSTDKVLDLVAQNDAIPLIIAEIPTNPRVEVPNLEKLREVLSKKRKTSTGEIAIDPVFILDQTFCPNVQFCGEDGILVLN